jgi:hypothetical protein
MVEKYRRCCKKNQVQETVFFFEYIAQLMACAKHDSALISVPHTMHIIIGYARDTKESVFHGTPRIQDNGTMKLYIQYGTDLMTSHSRKVPYGTLTRFKKQAKWALHYTRHRQCCVSGSGFNGVPGSGSVFASRIRIQEDKNVLF